MQPPIEYHAGNLLLPPMEAGTDYLCFVTKTYKYITLSFRLRGQTEIAEAFTIHQVEGKRLAEALQAAALEAHDPSFRQRLFGGTEGIHRGGPPNRSDIIELMEPGEKAAALAAQRPAQPLPSRKHWWRFW